MYKSFTTRTRHETATISGSSLNSLMTSTYQLHVARTAITEYTK